MTILKLQKRMKRWDESRVVIRFSKSTVRARSKRGKRRRGRMGRGKKMCGMCDEEEEEVREREALDARGPQ